MHFLPAKIVYNYETGQPLLIILLLSVGYRYNFVAVHTIVDRLFFQLEKTTLP